MLVGIILNFFLTADEEMLTQHGLRSTVDTACAKILARARPGRTPKSQDPTLTSTLRSMLSALELSCSRNALAHMQMFQQSEKR